MTTNSLLSYKIVQISFCNLYKEKLKNLSKIIIMSKLVIVPLKTPSTFASNKIIIYLSTNIKKYQRLKFKNI